MKADSVFCVLFFKYVFFFLMLWAPQMKCHAKIGMFGAMFTWLTDVSAFHSQPWWLPQLHPVSSTSPKFAFLDSKMTDRLASRIKLKSSASKHPFRNLWLMPQTPNMFFYSLLSSFDMMGDTEKTSVTRSESPKTICFHIYKVYSALGLYLGDFTF